MSRHQPLPLAEVTPYDEQLGVLLTGDEPAADVPPTPPGRRPLADPGQTEGVSRQPLEVDHEVETRPTPPAADGERR